MNRRTIVSVMAVGFVVLSLLAEGLAVSAAQEEPDGQPPPAQPKPGEGEHFSLVSPLAPVGSGFTYQGRLLQGGVPASGPFDFGFSLYDAESGGAQVGSTISHPAVTVDEGLFAVQLDFGNSAFQGDARWLEIAVQEAGGGGYTTLSPRTALGAVPYAHSLRPGAVVSGDLGSSTPIFAASNTAPTGIGVYGVGYFGLRGASTYVGVYGTGTNTGVWGQGDSYGVYGDSATGHGVYGLSSRTGAYAGVYGKNTNVGSGAGVKGEGGQYGVDGVANGFIGVRGTGNVGVQGFGADRGVYGQATNGPGVEGFSAEWEGVEGASTNWLGVYGFSNTHTGVRGSTLSGNGMYGSTDGDGTVAGVLAASYGPQGNGLIGEANNGSSAFGVWGKSTNGYAGYFSGRVHVTGNLSKGGGSFKIDHPLDPENKYLYHSFVESPDMMNIYNGNVTLDAKGEAAVTMPAWFDALNKEFRYQLTAIGAPGPNLYVAEEIKSNRFKIAGGTPGMKVSWMVTGIREDPYAERYRIPVEEEKGAGERGRYLHPELYGQSRGDAIGEKPLKPQPSTRTANGHTRPGGR